MSIWTRISEALAALTSGEGLSAVFDRLRSPPEPLMLSELAKGRGAGRKLLTALEDHARAAGMHSLIAGVAGENDAGRDFHNAMGYTTIATLPQVGRKFDRWMDLILMQKIL